MEHEATVEGVGVGVSDEGPGAPVVILEAREELIPIFVSTDQAQSMQLALEGEPFERPLTHDLFVEMVAEFGAAIDRVRIDDLADVLTTAARDGRKRPYDDVEVLSEVEVPLGVASNNQQRVVEAVNAEHGLVGQFETVHARPPTPASLREKKPNPLYVERARADVGTEEALYVGDRGKDIVAGNRAGLDTVLLRREHNRDRSVDADPTYEVDGLEGVVEILQSAAE